MNRDHLLLTEIIVGDLCKILNIYNLVVDILVYIDLGVMIVIDIIHEITRNSNLTKKTVIYSPSFLICGNEQASLTPIFYICLGSVEP